MTNDIEAVPAPVSDDRRPGSYETGYWCAACRERHAGSTRDLRFKHRMVCRASQETVDKRRQGLSEITKRAGAAPKVFTF